MDKNIFEKNDLPVWQIPVQSDKLTNKNSFLNPKLKFHCFVDCYSLCGKYAQDTDFYETGIESGEILRRPEIACKKCREICMRKYNVLCLERIENG